MITITILTITGLALGSFVNALVWRLHEQTKTQNKISLQSLSVVNGRSMCPSCTHLLAWYDLVPIFSWLSLRGNCRYCKKSISRQYPIIELCLAVLLPLSLYYWPYILQTTLSYIVFVLWIPIVVLLVAASLYDIKWMELPNRLLYPLAGLVVVQQILLAVEQHKGGTFISGLIGGIIVGGFFWIIYQISGGKWIGGGDVRYGFVMGLLLGWQKALLGLMVASYAGTIVVVILILIKKYHKKMKLPFGPFLISATYISLLWGQYFIDYYKRISGL